MEMWISLVTIELQKLIISFGFLIISSISLISLNAAVYNETESSPFYPPINSRENETFSYSETEGNGNKQTLATKNNEQHSGIN